MAIGTITLPDAGSVTEPSKIPLFLGVTFATQARDGIPISTVDVPHQAATILANGVDPVRHLQEGAIYRTGLLAPSTAITATPSGVQATALLDLDVAGNGASIYNPAANEWIVLGGIGVVFVADIADTGTGFPYPIPSSGLLKVLIEASGDLTLDNIIDILDNENQGTKWDDQGGAGDRGGVVRSLVELVSHPTSYQMNIRAVEYGTGGNSIGAGLLVGTWTDCAFGSNGGTVGGGSFMENGADGTDTDTPPPGEGSYKYVQQFFREADGALSAAGPESAAAEQNAAQDIDLTAISESADSTATYTRWSRTLTNQARYYRGNDLVQTDTTDTDTKTDAELLAFPVIYRGRDFRTYRAGHIPRYRVVEHHQGRIFGAGALLAADYTSGTAAVTTTGTGSTDDVVTISSGYPVAEWEGRTFIVDSTAEEYLITSVDTANAKITLDRDYQDATAASAGYTVKDTRDANELGYSTLNKFNQWPGQNTITGVVSRGGEGITGLKSIWEVLVVFTRDGVWRLLGSSPNSYSLRQVRGASGAVSHNSIVEADALYWLSPSGVMRWDGQSSPENIAKPRLNEGQVRGINATIKRINTPHSHLSHGIYDKEQKTIRWFVPLDDEIAPGHAIVYDTQSGAFSLDRVPAITASGVITGTDGEDVVVLGTQTGELFQADVSNSDGAFGFEPKTTATAATTTTWTDSAATFPTAGDGLSGVSFWGKQAAGDFVRATIQSNTATALTFTEHLDAAFSIGDEGYVGAIPMHFRSGKFHLGIPEEDHTISNLSLHFSPDVDGTAFVATGANQDALNIPTFGSASADLTLADGEELMMMNETGKFHQFETYCLEPGCDPQFLAIGMLVQARGKARAGL